MAIPTMLAELWGMTWLFWWQPLVLIMVVLLLVGLKIYRSKQM